MKRALLVALAAVFALAGCASHASSPPPPASRADVDRVLDDWHDAAAKADEERYFSHFAPDAVFLGTDATERWTVEQFRAYAHPHFAKGKAWSFHVARRDVSFAAAGDVAWFDEDLDTPNLGPARGSGVLVRQGTWKIAQYNLAITVPNASLERVKPLLIAPVAAP